MTVRLQIRAGWAAAARWVSHLMLGAGGLILAVVLWTQIESALYQSVQARQFAAGTREPATIEPMHFVTPRLQSRE
jgi:hypothetical protein